MAIHNELPVQYMDNEYFMPIGLPANAQDGQVLVYDSESKLQLRWGDFTKGEKGDPGQSIKGDKGEPGRDGRDGRDGINGKDGVDGKNGKDGKQGPQGPPGLTRHNLLSHLDYINSGHTGFASSEEIKVLQAAINHLDARITQLTALQQKFDISELAYRIGSLEAFEKRMTPLLALERRVEELENKS